MNSAMETISDYRHVPVWFESVAYRIRFSMLPIQNEKNTQQIYLLAIPQLWWCMREINLRSLYWSNIVVHAMQLDNMTRRYSTITMKWNLRMRFWWNWIFSIMGIMSLRRHIARNRDKRQQTDRKKMLIEKNGNKQITNY